MIRLTRSALILQKALLTVELPLEVLENFDEAIDEALGEDISEEPHHDESALPEGEAVIDIPTDAVEDIDEVADEALDTAVEVADEVTDVFEGGDDDGDDDDDPTDPDGDGESFDEEPVEKEGMDMPAGSMDMSNNVVRKCRN
jgi:hypothetical protein